MEYRLLGPLEVLDGQGPLPLAGAKQRALLALLLLHANQVVSRDRLIDELWGERAAGDRGAERCRCTSRSCARCSAGRRRCSTRPPGYLLRVEPDELDLHRFERLLAEARRRSRRAIPQARRCLAQALGALARAAARRLRVRAVRAGRDGRLEELRLAALEERIEADLALGRHAELVGELEALVAEHRCASGCAAS